MMTCPTVAVVATLLGLAACDEAPAHGKAAASRGPVAPPAIRVASQAPGFVADFEDGSVQGGPWAVIQTQRSGSVETVPDPTNPQNSVAVMRAGGKSLFGSVGKADLVHRFEPVGAGRTIAMHARIFAPEGAALDSVILMDLECASCGIDTNPGIRLYLRDGRLRVDLSKIGIKDAMLPTVPHKLVNGRWYDIEWRVTLGTGSAGRSVVRLDGEVVMDVRGETLLSQERVSKIADVDITEAVDRFQVGLTANSNGRATTLLLDDVSFSIL